MSRRPFEKTNSSEEKGDRYKESQETSDKIQPLDLIKETSMNHEVKTARESQIFGLNFLQDMKGVPEKITGAYDPKQELWIRQRQGQGSPEGNVRIPGQHPDHFSKTEQSGSPQDWSTDRSTSYTTNNDTHVPGGGDIETDTGSDSYQDA